MRRGANNSGLDDPHTWRAPKQPPDSRSTATVDLHARDVFTRAWNSSSALVFRASAPSRLHFSVTFAWPAGEPLPDQCTMSNVASKVEVQYNGRGVLLAASGYPAGTPASLTIAQTGRSGLPSPLNGTDNGVADGFPAELVILRPLQ